MFYRNILRRKFKFMSTYTAENIIEGIRNHDDEIMRFIYKTNYHVIEHMIRKNKGKKEDAKDIFQEALIIIFKKIQSKGLVLTCSFSTYVYAVCEHLWLKVLRERKKIPETFGNFDDFTSDSGLNKKIERKKLELFEFHFNKLSKDCQKILKLHFSGVPIAEIMKKMGYNSKQHTMDRKYRCKKSLFKRIENDPTFKKIQDELF